MTDAAGAPLILVADDDADIVALVRLRLERAGYEVVTACDGLQAMAAVDERVPDLAVIDVMMPRMDGHEVVRALRSRPDTARLPVIVLTAAVHDRVADASADAGVDVHMRKPFSPRELVARADELLGRARPA